MPRKPGPKKSGSAKASPKKANAARLPAILRDKSFLFQDVISILKSTGIKAGTIKQLRNGIAKVSPSCIFNHTHQYFAQGHSQEYTNEFSHWASEALEERALAEHLSNIDPYDFNSIQELRESLLKEIDFYIDNFPAPRDVIPGNEFYFTETLTYVFPTGLRARNLAEFLIALKYLDSSSIYYHFYEARNRLGKDRDDFSAWVDEVMGQEKLAAEMRAIDPFMHTMEGIRNHLIQIIEKTLRRQMEGII